MRHHPRPSIRFLLPSLLLLGASATAQAPGLLAPGVNTTALHHFDAPGTTAHDSGRYQLDAVLDQGATKVAAPWGQALRLDGSIAGVATLADTAARTVPPGKPFTLEVWVRLDRVGATAPIPILSRESLLIQPTQTRASALEFQYVPFPGGWSFKFMDPTGLPMRVYRTYKVHAGRWYHLAFTWDGQEGELYCNGESLSRLRFSAYYGYDPQRPWVIGGGEGGTRLVGALDELHFANDRIWPIDFRTMHTHYGFGKPGSGLIWPTIQPLGGPPATTGPGQAIRIGSGFPGAPGLLYVSDRPDLIVLAGGFFLLGTTHLAAIPFTMDMGLAGLPGTATALVPITPPGSALVGRSLFFQGLAIDPGVSSLFSLTPGLALHFPY